MTVAFLGTGVMGAPMARNLARAGLTVMAWNRTAAKAEGIEGVRAAPTPAAAADGADLLVTMLADAPAIEAAVVGPDGALPALGAEGLWVQMSTVGVHGADRLARLAAEQGIAYVDAPVLGSREPAERGELVILGSGPADMRERCEPLFRALAERTVWVGPAGAGSRLKVVVNAWLMATTAALAETVALAERLDVDPTHFLDVTDGGAIAGLYAQANGPAMASRDFVLNFPLELAAKDARLAVEAAAETGPALRVFEGTLAQYERAVELGHGALDWSALIHAVAVSG